MINILNVQWRRGKVKSLQKYFMTEMLCCSGDCGTKLHKIIGKIIVINLG